MFADIYDLYLFIQAYAAGCNIVILASNFERVQIIPGAIHSYVRIGSLDCSTDTGKIAASYGAEVCIFEPTPLIHTAATTHVSISLYVKVKNKLSTYCRLNI